VPGGSPRRLREADGQAAAWSWDGQSMVCPDGHDLFLAKSDGPEPHKLVSAPDQAYYPAWSPDGKVIRFNVLLAQSSRGGLRPWAPDGSYFRVKFAHQRFGDFGGYTVAQRVFPPAAQCFWMAAAQNLAHRMR
jgi:hypothetical protein